MLLRIPNTFLTAAAGLFFGLAAACSGGESEPSITRMADLPSLPDGPNKTILPTHTSEQKREVTLSFVGEVRGELEPCGCPTLPFGGFERRATQLEKLQTLGPGPVFHIDAGDTLVKGFSTKRIDKLGTRAREMLRLSSMVGVDLWVPGTSDLIGLPVNELVQAAGPQRISATWLDSSGQLLLPATAILERDGFRLGVIGLSGRPPADSDVGYRPPLEAVEIALSTLPDDLDWVIAVSNVRESERASVAQQATGISAIFSTRGESYDTPGLTVDGIPVIETPDRGRYLQVVHARLAADSAAPLLLHPEPPVWRARLSAIRRGAEDKLDTEGLSRNLGLVNTIPLSADLDKTSDVSDRLLKYKSDRREEAIQKSVQISDDAPAYASSGACVNCHTSEFARWTMSGHARAWTSLVKRKETNNPECVGCHTTAYGEPGGLGELSESNIRKFKGVQCEMCHGPLSGHPSNPDVTAQPVRESDCIVCHDEANSPDFDFESYLVQASCQGGAPAIVPTPPDL